MNFHEDDRAQRLLDVFGSLKGQINVSYVNSTTHIAGWHAHKAQTDYWICLKGSFKVGLVGMDKKEGKVKWEYLSDKNPRVLEIKPYTYHGYRALEPHSILLYYLTHKYNPADEFREKVGAFGECWEAKNE